MQRWIFESDLALRNRVSLFNKDRRCAELFDDWMIELI